MTKDYKYSAYITFEEEIAASLAIVALDGFILNGRKFEASQGTNKFCESYIRGKRCKKKSCNFIHYQPLKQDIFSRDDSLENKTIFLSQKERAYKIISLSRGLIRVPGIDTKPFENVTLKNRKHSTNTENDNSLPILPSIEETLRRINDPKKKRVVKTNIKDQSDSKNNEDYSMSNIGPQDLPFEKVSHSISNFASNNNPINRMINDNNDLMKIRDEIQNNDSLGLQRHLNLVENRADFAGSANLQERLRLRDILIEKVQEIGSQEFLNIIGDNYILNKQLGPKHNFDVISVVCRCAECILFRTSILNSSLERRLGCHSSYMLPRNTILRSTCPIYLKAISKP